MSQLADDWEIVSRRSNNRILALLSMLLQTALTSETTFFFSTVTWTVRQTATGVVREVTARSEQDAKEKIALGAFDKE